MRFGVIIDPKLGKIFARLEGDRAIEYGAPPWLGGRETGKVHPFSPENLAAPVDPRKVLCIGRNYAAHAKELGNDVPKEPLLFLKPSSSIIGPGEAIVLPRESSKVEHEAELAIVVGKRIKNASADEARAAIFGFTCACDVTARDLQKSDGQWSRAKGFDTFCPIGPWIETELDFSDVSIKCIVNGETKQNGRTSQMVFDVPMFLSYASHAMTLEPGDLLLSGTPEGVGPLKEGDRVEVEIERIGTLAVGVRA